MPTVQSTLTDAPGLFRTALAGRGARLVDAFEALRTDPRAVGDTSAAGGLFGAQVDINPANHADGGWELINLRDQVYVVVSDCVYPQDSSEINLPDDLVELHFTLSGNSMITNGVSTAEGRTFDLFVCMVGKQAWYSVNLPHGRRRSVAIFARRKFFERFVDPATPDSAKVQRELDSVGDEQVYFCRLRAALTQVELLGKLVDNPYRDRRRLLYAEAITTELICSSIDLWAEHSDAAADHTLVNPRDVLMLQAARKLVLEDLTTVFTIDQLARHVGTNSAKLKAGFRVLFGCTVFELALKARMDAALEMLLAQRGAIADVAEAVGYRHASSFTTAFQQYFGFAPRVARRLASPVAASTTLPETMQP